MSGIPPELADIINSGPLAHLATVNPDGGPQVSVIWIGLDGDDVVSGHLSRRQKVRNVQREPRVVLSFDTPRRPGVFLAEHAILQARATIEQGGAARELLERLGKIYVGPDFEFPAPKDADGYLLRYSIERVGGTGPWAASAH
jgi:PPOX class probable F420-dependent enzyme